MFSSLNFQTSNYTKPIQVSIQINLRFTKNISFVTRSLRNNTQFITWITIEIRIIKLEVNSIKIRREVARENPRFLEETFNRRLRNGPRNNLHRYDLEHTLQKEVSQCCERFANWNANDRDNRKARSSLSPYLLSFVCDPLDFS